MELSTFAGGVVALLLLTSFVKIVTTLTIFRFGIGLQQSGFGIVIIALSLALTLVIMSPQVQELGGVNAILSGNLGKADINYEQKFRPFLEKNAEEKVVTQLTKLVEKKTQDPAKVSGPASFPILVSSFLLTELKEAFQLGAMILVPFLVIDLLVINALLLLGVRQVSSEVIALPLKILLFFAVDGWNLLAEKLIKLYV